MSKGRPNMAVSLFPKKMSGFCGLDFPLGRKPVRIGKEERLKKDMRKGHTGMLAFSRTESFKQKSSPSLGLKTGFEPLKTMGVHLAAHFKSQNSPGATTRYLHWR